MVPWLFGWEVLSCFVAENNSKLVVLFGDHFLPWAFFRLGGVEGQLSGNGSPSNMDIIGRMLLRRWKVTGVGSYSFLEFAFSPVNDRIVCCEEGHPEEHGVSSKIYDEEWVCVGFPLMMNLEVSDLGDFSYTILGSIYITDGSGIWEILGWNREIADYVWRNEIFGCATVN